MTWQLVSCPGKDPVYFQFQTGANIWWTSLWVRNPRIAIKSLEVQSANHAQWFALERGTDGTFTDSSGFGDGAFTLRVTGIDGSTYQQTFKSFQPGDLVAGTGNL
jgi:expansin (peptidoglycan-binding protein)